MKNIIFMADMKIDGKISRTDAYQYSINSWKHWAQNNNARVVTLTEPLVDLKEMGITWQRYYLFELLKDSGIEYDQVLIVDSDTIVHANCPNFFELTEGKYCAVHNEGSYDWTFRSIENYSKYLFNGYMFDFTRYINGGWQIVNKKFEPFFNAMVQFYNEHKKTLLWMQETFHVGTDQPVLNFLLNMYNIDLKILPYEFNGQDLALHEGLVLEENGKPLFTEFCYISHFNAIPNNKESKISNDWMRYTYEYFYGKL